MDLTIVQHFVTKGLLVNEDGKQLGNASACIGGEQGIAMDMEDC